MKCANNDNMYCSWDKRKELKIEEVNMCGRETEVNLVEKE